MRRFIAAWVALCFALGPIQSGAVLKAVSGVGTASNVTITGGSITGVSGVPYTLAMGGIPLIGLSSGSVASNGAISGITALPLTYSAAYCWFPANILAASIAAGWYYCTFSSGTAGTAFLNTYTSGVPTIPTSPTAVSAGQGAFTGDIGEEFGVTVTVPANALGATGSLRIGYSTLQTNNANTKTLKVRWSGNGGSTFGSQSLASVVGSGAIMEINNQATSANFSQALSSYGGTVNTVANQAIDSTASTTVVFSMQRGTATDNIVLYPPVVEVLH